MKTIILISISLTLAVSIVLAQTSSTTQPQSQTQQTQRSVMDKPLTDVLGWMIGNWEGEGVSQGEREFLGRMSVNPELDNVVLLVRRESMNKTNPGGAVKELMVIGFDGTTKNLIGTVYNSNNVIGLYVGELRQNEIVFSTAVKKEGYIDRRIFRLLPDGGISFVIERGSPGKAVGKQVEVNFKKKA